ncbi:PEP-CTERM sorting domain-containing protein [Massilia endophytica]|uniref:PEP-CTERM sorting domain-containing protein n=1 Tax=Massilia endophytica TaxID=2899220 RepID=UPI001E463E44|nr:PEP-CTERM sorting domain-containing protein [Massilia endophytica]UGQ47659.1 PEP-CTERM sorting domain-containing protein [Massilia endophytica]
MTSALLRKLLPVAFAALAGAGVSAQQAQPAETPPARGASPCLDSIKNKQQDKDERERAKSDARIEGIKSACRLEDGRQLKQARIVEEGRKVEQWKVEEDEQELRKFNEGHEGTHTLKLIRTVETIDVTESETRRKIAEVPWAPYAVDEFGFIEKYYGQFSGIDGQFGIGGLSLAAGNQAKQAASTADSKKAAAMAAVPEPATWALLLAGLALLPLTRRR